MNIESRRIDRSTATSVTSASRPNVLTEPMSPHSACAAKNVANRIAIAAASSAFAVTGYLRAAFSSQPARRPMATIRPMATRTGGSIHPCSME